MNDDELSFDASEKLLTIGALVDALRREFPDISVSKLRYLEEQGLVTPQRTKSGYRLYSREDFSRLVRVLSMQRDEYMPLKVIRRELERNPAPTLPTTRQGLPKTEILVKEQREYTADEIHALTGADPTLLAELEEYELVRPRQIGGVRRYLEVEAGIVGAAAQLAQMGLRPKHLRLYKSAVDREIGLVEQILLPALMSSKPERRREALDQIDNIVSATAQLRQLLLSRGLHELTAKPQ